jgi:hypothetical protein
MTEKVSDWFAADARDPVRATDPNGRPISSNAPANPVMRYHVAVLWSDADAWTAMLTPRVP